MYQVRLASPRLCAVALSSLGLLVAATTIPSNALAQPPAQGAAMTDSARRNSKPLPLATTRKVAFTTSKGSWMSLDVSPDGQTIVFDLLGDLYTMPIGGGKATRLTSGPGYDVQPRFSPDGKRVVFVSDRSGGENLWLLTLATKDSTQLTKGNTSQYVSPEWTPDGEYVVASKSTSLFGTAKLWLFHVDGGTGTALVSQPAPLKMLGATFGPNPRYIWFAARQGDWSYNAVFPQYQIGTFDRETGSMTTMSTRIGSAFRPALSPDGKWLVYGSRHETQTGLRIRNLESGVEDWLAYPVQRDDKESRAPLDVLPGFSFTPDSKALIASYGGEFWRVPVDRTPATKIAFSADVDLDVGPQVKFANRVDDGVTFAAHQIRDAAPSPDGTKLAFSALGRLYVMDWPDGTPRRLTNLELGEHEPTWAPDGKSIAFVSWKDDQGGHLWRAAVDGRTAPVQLTKVSALYRGLAWSPSGRLIAQRGAARDMQEASSFFASLGAEFVWIPATGGDLRVIGPTGGRSGPHFTQDSTRIFAYSFSEGLVSFRWDGTDVKSHLKVTGPIPPGAIQATIPGSDLPNPLFLDLEPTPPQAPPASAVVISPRGMRALAQVGNDVYMVTVPYLANNAATVSVASPDNAAFPVKKLTDVGGEFPVWSGDGKKIHWSVGAAHVVYDLDRAKVVDDSVKAVAKEKADSAARARSDTTTRQAAAAAPARPDSTKAAYKPFEKRVVITVQRDMPQGVAVLRGARAVTMKGDEVIENADIVIRNNRIAAVGARGSVEVPAGANIIDVSGKTIVPGFVDTHYHTQWLVPGVHKSQVWQYLTNLAYGVTATRDPQTSSTDVLTYGDRVEAGDMIGPRVYHTGPGVFLGDNIRDLDHARTVLKRYASYYDVKTLKMYMTGNRQQRQWIIMAAKELGIMPTTEGGLDFKLNMTHAIDGYSGIEHAVPIAPLYEDVVQVFAKTGVVNSPTLLVSYGGPFGENYYYTFENPYEDQKIRRFTPQSELYAKASRRGQGTGGSPGPAGWARKEEYVFPLHAKFMKDIVAAGGKVGVGAHGQFHGLGYHWELWSMQSGGLSPHDALKAATIFGAWAIGYEQDIGSLEAGKLADLVIMDRNPLENIRNTNSISRVMKNGRLYDGETLDEVWPRQRKLPKFDFQNGGPITNAGIR